MLTGNKDHSMAVQAFNEGIIDHFLVKDSPNLIDQLVHSIDKMQKSYFSSLMVFLNFSKSWMVFSLIS